MKTNDELRDNVVKLSYKLINDLLYFNDDEKELHLCIFFIMKIKVFKFVYDEMKHFDYARIYKRFI